MKKVNNFVQYQSLRQYDDRYNRVIQDKYIVTQNLIKRLGLSKELEGHTGCVNCLEWSSNGQILASGSDDVQVILWDPFKNKKLATIPTGHTGNIFSVKFLPNTENRTVISGGADQSIRVHDVTCNDVIRVCSCHTNRVKRIVTDPISPQLFWTAGEDGVVLQHDLRSPHTCPAPEVKNERNVLIDLCPFLGTKAEAKCLAINNVKTDHLAVGANDPYVRMYDRRMIKMGKHSWQSKDDGAVQYFVPGHLPAKFAEYKRKYRSLASTYITFSPDGKELLVNLGGEQVYLFPLVEQWQSEVCNLVVPDLKAYPNGVKDHGTGSNGYSNGLKNGTTSHNNDIAHVDIMRGMRRTRKPSEKVRLLPSAAEDLKIKANKAFEEKKYAKAVHLYNEGIRICSDSAILYGNRSAALLKRDWDGDAYAAFKDCQVAFFLDPNHHKALLRMARCLLNLGRSAEAAECYRIFKIRFPEQLKTDLCQSVEKDIQKVFPSTDLTDTQISVMLAALLKPVPASSSSVGSTAGTSSGSSEPQTSPTALTRSDFLRRRSSSAEEATSSNENLDVDDNNSATRHESQGMGDFRNHSSDSDSSTATSSTQTSNKPGHKRPEFYDLETKLRDKSVDFSNRFCGHCNTTTDIKEANFFGGYIVAGSDDGSFFIWDRKTTNIVSIIKGDESIVNCLQPHPTTCMLATSGIESVIRLWTPMSEEGFVNDRVVDDINDAAYANQKRMNSNPFEVILMNMGYRLSGNEDEDDDAAPRDVPVTACNPS